MGQRFQIITKVNNSFKVYHSQWLWGDYAIRRIGTAINNFLLYNKNGYREFEDYLKGSFYGKPQDMNSFYRYFDNPNEYSDNEEILSIWKGKKKFKVKTKDFKSFLKELNNNDGFFYIEFGEKGIKGEMGVFGYCFLLREELKPISAEEYLKNYTRQEGFNKKQLKEFEDGKKVFSKLRIIEIPKTIKRLKND